MATWMLILATLLAQAPQQPRAVLPAGTPVRIRFPESIEGGREQVGAVVRLQTTSALEAGGCSVVPAFAPIAATVVVSRSARIFDRSGRLALRFDSLSVSPGNWVPLVAVLDSLEWADRGTVNAQGELRERGRSIRGIVGTAGAAGIVGTATGIGVVPVFVLAGLDLVLRGGTAHILSGQRGALRLTASLEVPGPERCEPATDPWASTATPTVPPVPPRATDKRGGTGADPINLIFLGSAAAVDTAFARAGWMNARRSTFGSLSRETEAILMQSRDSAAPMSHEYYQGRVEDLRFERASPSARVRHHVRLWQADSSGTLWAAAATEDVGMLVSPLRRTVTHRIAPDIDRERDLLVGDLLAGGCVALDGYATLPGAQRSGTAGARQPFVTDARVAVLRAVACAGAGPVPGPPS